MERIDGVPDPRPASPTAWAAVPRAARPRPRGAGRRARRDPRRRLAGRAAWRRPGPPRRLPRAPDGPLADPARLLRWPRPAGGAPHRRLARRPPPGRPGAGAVPRRLQARQRAVRARRAPRAAGRRRLGDGVDRRPARRPRVGAHLPPRARAARCRSAWQGTARSPSSTSRRATRSSSATRERSGRDVGDLGWYDVFSRWKLAIVLEGSYAKFVRGLSDKPMHECFGAAADLLLASASTLIESTPTIERGARP